MERKNGARALIGSVQDQAWRGVMVVMFTFFGYIGVSGNQRLESVETSLLRIATDQQKQSLSNEEYANQQLDVMVQLLQAILDQNQKRLQSAEE